MEQRQALAQFLIETVGERIDWLSAPISFGLPHYLKMAFRLFPGRLLGTDCLFAFAENVEELPTATLEKHFNLLQEKTRLPSVIVFDHLSGRTAERLIKRRVSFIVIGTQIFLPFLLIRLRKEHDLLQVGHEVGPLSPAAESILVGQLLDGRFEGKSGELVAEELRDSSMLASKAIRELEERQLCRVRKDGRKKLLTFGDRGELWETAKHLLRNPVQTIRYATQKPLVPWAVAGISALSKQSLLADDQQRTVAVYRRDLQQDKGAEQILSADPEVSKYRVEVWNRKPWLFSSKDKAIDPISLYLTLRNETDDRVQSELAMVLSRIGLSIQGGLNG